MSQTNERGIVTKPGRSGAFASTYEIAVPDPLIDERGYRLLKYDGNGSPVYVSPKEYKEVMGPDAKQRSRRKPKGFGKGKKR